MSSSRRILAILVTAAVLTLVREPASGQIGTAAVTVNPQQEVLRRLFDFKAGLEKSEAQLETAAKQTTAALNASYILGLDRAIAAATKAGQLEEILKLRADKEVIATGKPLPSEDEKDTPASLKSLREAYRKVAAKNTDEHRKRQQPVYAAYDRALADYQVALTKQGRIEDATRVKAARETAAGKLSQPGPDTAAPEEEALAIKGDVKPTLAFDTLRKKGGVLKGVGFYAREKHLPLDVSPAKNYNDMTSVLAAYDGEWMALRSGGEVVGWAWNGKKNGPFSDRRVKRAVGGDSPSYVTASGEAKALRNVGVKSAAAQLTSHRIYFTAAHGKDVITFDQSGDYVSHVFLTKDRIAPPKTLFHGAASIIAIGYSGLLGFFEDKPPIFWEWSKGGKRSDFPDTFKGCIEGESKGGAVVMRNAKGAVFTANTNLGKVDPDLIPPTNLPPAIRVRAGKDWCAAQAADGSWQAWGKSGELVKKIKEIGVAIDLAGTDSDLNTGCLLWIEPEKRP